jgi:DNA (cytosine-5)-methyltransferase 1
LRAYYNDNDRHAAAWLRELIKAGMITDGDVDERSIAEVKGADLKGYGRVGLLRGYGNTIVPEVAAKFVKAFMEVSR